MCAESAVYCNHLCGLALEGHVTKMFTDIIEAVCRNRRAAFDHFYLNKILQQELKVYTLFILMGGKKEKLLRLHFQ